MRESRSRGPNRREKGERVGGKREGGRMEVDFNVIIYLSMWLRWEGEREEGGRKPKPGARGRDGGRETSSIQLDCL